MNLSNYFFITDSIGLISTTYRLLALHFMLEIREISSVARCPVFDRTVRFFGDLSGQKYDAKPDN